MASGVKSQGRIYWCWYASVFNWTEAEGGLNIPKSRNSSIFFIVRKNNLWCAKSHLHCSVPRPTITDPPPCRLSPPATGVVPPPMRTTTAPPSSTHWGIFCVSNLRFESIFLGVFPVGLGFVLLCFLTFWCSQVVSVDGGWNTSISANGDGGVFQWGSHILLAHVLAGFSHLWIFF